MSHGSAQDSGAAGCGPTFWLGVLAVIAVATGLLFLLGAR